MKNENERRVSGRIAVFFLLFSPLLLIQCHPPGPRPDKTKTTVAAPVFDPASGAVMERMVTPLVITTTAADATVYYTLDGSPPTEDSSLYSGPVCLDLPLQGDTVTVKAIAVKTGSTDSAVSTATYTIEDSAPGVVIESEKERWNTAPVVTISFSEGVTGFTASDIAIDGGNAEVSLFTAAGPTVYAATLSPNVPDAAAEITISVPEGVCEDMFGNPNNAGSAFTVTYDPTAPQGVISSIAPNPTNLSPLPFTITFDKRVNGFTALDLAVENGDVSGFNDLANPVFEIQVTPNVTSGAVLLSVPGGVCTDDAGNNNAETLPYSVTYDSVRPSVTVNQSETQPDPAGKSTSPISFTVVFSEQVTGFSAGDVLLGGFAGPTGVAVSGSGAAYTVAVSGVTCDGTITASIPAGAAFDPAMNGNSASTSLDNSVRLDLFNPSVVSISSPTRETTGAFPLPIIIVFSEAIDPLTFTEDDISVSGTADAKIKEGLLVTQDNITWTAAVVADDPGTISVTIGAGVCADPTGELNEAAGTALNRTFVTEVRFETYDRVQYDESIDNLNVHLYTSAHPGSYNFVVLYYSYNNSTPVSITTTTIDQIPVSEIPGMRIEYTSGSTTSVLLLYGAPAVDFSPDFTVRFSRKISPIKLSIASFYNVDPANPVGATAVLPVAVNANGIEAGITTTSNRSLVLDCFVATICCSLSYGAGQTIRWIDNQNSIYFNPLAGVSTKPAENPEPTSMSWIFMTTQAVVRYMLMELKILY